MLYIWYYIFNGIPFIDIDEKAFDEVQWKKSNKASDCDCSLAFWLGEEAEGL